MLPDAVAVGADGELVGPKSARLEFDSNPDRTGFVRKETHSLFGICLRFVRSLQETVSGYRVEIRLGLDPNLKLKNRLFVSKDFFLFRWIWIHFVSNRPYLAFGDRSARSNRQSDGFASVRLFM